MPLQFSVKGLDTLASKVRELSKTPDRDFRRVLSSAQRATKTETKRACTRVYGVKPSRVMQDIRAPGVKGQPPFFSITGIRQPISLLNYDFRGGRRGVSVVVLRKKGRRTIDGAFVARAPNGGLLPWKRTGQAKRRMAQGRYAKSQEWREPIKPLFGPSAADMLNNPDVFDTVKVFALTKMSSELSRTIARIISRG